MTLTTITALPTTPNRATDTPTEFADNADAYLVALSTHRTELIAFGNSVVDTADGANYSTTSVTSNSIGTGSKSFTGEGGKRFLPGTYLLIADTAAPTTNWMYGQVTSYNFTTGALVFDSQRVAGSGTKTAWSISLTGVQGEGGDVLPSFTSNSGKSLIVNSGETAGEWTFPDAYCYLSANYTLTSSTAVQKLFNSSTNGTLTLPTGRYWFELMAHIDTMSATSGNADIYLKGAGTATLANGLATLTGYDGAAGSSLSFASGYTELSGGDLFIGGATATTSTELFVRMSGFFSVSVAGTIIPSIDLFTAAAAVVRAGSSFMCRRIGTTATTNGSWS